MYITITLLYAKYDYYISNKNLFVECDKEENVEVTEAAAAATSCFEKKFVRGFVQCRVFAQSSAGRRPNDEYPG